LIIWKVLLEAILHRDQETPSSVTQILQATSNSNATLQEFKRIVQTEFH
jgi:hypothetical protein